MSETIGINTTLASGAVHRAYSDFVYLFSANDNTENGYQLGALAYTNYVGIDNMEWAAYLQIFYKSDQTGTLYYKHYDDEGHVSELEATLNTAVFGTASGNWRDVMTSSPTVFGKRCMFRIKNTSSTAAGNYWLKMAMMGLG